MIIDSIYANYDNYYNDQKIFIVKMISAYFLETDRNQTRSFEGPASSGRDMISIWLEFC